MGFRDAMNPFQKPDFSTPGAGASSGARIGSAFGPIGTGIGALGGWIAGRVSQGRLTDLANRGASLQQSWNERRSADIWGGNSSPMGQFSGFGAGVDPGAPDNIGDALGITDYSDRGGGGSGGGFEVRSSGSIMPTGSQTAGYSVAGGGFGAGVGQGGGGMRSYQVNSGSLSASNYTGGGGTVRRKGDVSESAN